MELATKTMAAEISHDAAALAFGVGLDGMADVARGVAWFDGRDAKRERVVGHLDKAGSARLDVAHSIHAAGVAVPAVDNEGYVDVDDIALAQGFGAGDAMTDDVIERGARGMGVAPIIQRRGDSLVVEGEVED